MKAILNSLFEYEKLTHEGARQVLLEIADGQYNTSQIAAFLVAYRMRPVSVEELRGFRAALLELCRPVDLSDYSAIDLCGTGGDGKNTFNVSTLTAFVVAGAGYPVAKHGNYGVSSACGSSNVMEFMGYKFTADSEALKRQLDRAGICILHAPLFHPAMKAVAPIRRELGMKTFFNMLGPLVNPSRPNFQLVGVFNLELARIYKYIFQQEGQRYTIVHSLDGYDEVSLTGDFRMITPEKDEVRSPQSLGFDRLQPEDLYGGDTVPEAAAIFRKVIGGNGSEAQNQAVLANATLALKTLEPGKSTDDCREMAKASLMGGKAEEALNTLLQTN